ncbi:MAG: hypothetical protein LBG97_07385 [Coriobacteriales bacterium]|jgi:hypothetical protein|nr:hypothetical protein [Coriobacteriales bacterium]
MLRRGATVSRIAPGALAVSDVLGTFVVFEADGVLAVPEVLLSESDGADAVVGESEVAGAFAVSGAVGEVDAACADGEIDTMGAVGAEPSSGAAKACMGNSASVMANTNNSFNAKVLLEMLMFTPFVL